MEIDGYVEHASAEPKGELRVFVCVDVAAFLQAEAMNGNGNRPGVAKVDQILKKLRMHGLKGVNNAEQFVHEGKFPSGKRAGGDMAVYAVKAFKVRVYGGFVRIDGESLFLCPEAAIKKRDKADPDQLKRVARSLGDRDERG